jgi:hypothetical protein
MQANPPHPAENVNKLKRMHFSFPLKKGKNRGFSGVFRVIIQENYSILKNLKKIVEYCYFFVVK